MINYWLAKQEPSGSRAYNFSTLKKKSKTRNAYDFLDYLLMLVPKQFGLL
jgi:hypothetical protein